MIERSRNLEYPLCETDSSVQCQVCPWFPVLPIPVVLKFSCGPLATEIRGRSKNNSSTTSKKRRMQNTTKEDLGRVTENVGLPEIAKPLSPTANVRKTTAVVSSTANARPKKKTADEPKPKQQKVIILPHNKQQCITLISRP